MKYNIALGIVCLSLLSLLVSCDKDDPISPSEPTTPSTTEEKLDAALESVISEMEMPGFSLAIVKDGTLSFQQSFGFANLEQEIPYSNQTTQAIGSISKTFIGAAVVKAIESGYFTLDTEINDLLPFEINNPKAPGTNIKVKDLVTHTSGLLDNRDIYDAAYYIVPGENINTPGAQLMINLLDVEQRSGTPLEAFLKAYYVPGGMLYSNDNFASAQAGQVYNYSNIASSLAAYIVEAATGQAFDAYVKDQVFTPLGMDHTSYISGDQSATLYFDKSTPLPIYSNDSYPDGFVHTSNEDMTKYLLEMMRGATGNNPVLFSETTYDLLFTPLLADGIVPNVIGKNHGIFWTRNDASISHDGSDPGLNTVLQFFEDGETGFLLLTNMDSSTDENEEQFVKAFLKIIEAISDFISAN
ncbi:MAG: hypothetical protein Sapg2KO_46710 [Saprospiraceae bacterium]